MRLLRTVTLLSCTAAACVPSRSATFGPVARDVEARVGVKPAWGDPRVAGAVREMLAKPLDRDAAVRIAIASNRGLQADFDALDVAAADVAAATVLAPAEVDLELKGMWYGLHEYELSVVQDVLDLVQLGQRRGVADAGVAAARARATAATVELAASAEMAFHDAVAAQQQLELRQTAFDAAAAAAELAERMRAAGNIPLLEQARQQDAREQARLELGRAQADVELARERVNEVLGLSGDDTRWTLVPRLDEVEAAAPSLDGLERDAIAASLALAAIGADRRAASARLGIARLRAWLPELGLGVTGSYADGHGWNVGPALTLGLPIFDQQQGPRARARAELRASDNRAAHTAVVVRARARAIRMRVLEAHAESRHLATVVLPLRRQILDETLKHYNAMDASTFELVAARRGLVDAGRQHIDALRRYHNAAAAARALARGGLPDAGGETAIEAATPAGTNEEH